MATYKPLQSIILTTTPTSVTFSGIDQNYTDLKVIVNGTSTSLVDSFCRVNGDTSSSYSYTRLYGTGSAASSDRSSTQTEFKAGNFNTTPNSHILHFMNYSSTTVFKTMLFNTKESASAVIAHSCLWSNNAAITSITIYVTSGTFTAGSTFDLYGIKSGAPQALGGDLVTTDGNYWYHTFNSTQTFTPLRPLTVDYLVVAGGGGGGSQGGGGGAGGYRAASGFSVASSINYAITVGAGGAGGTSRGQGAIGNNSVFSTITSDGGGFGGGNGGNGGNGGSGGGGGIAAFTVRTGGTGVSGQGNAGGNNPGTANFGAGGGGGASEAGAASLGNAAGAGGAGSSSSISGTSTAYAGGGGGGGTLQGAVSGSGGTGGGGNGVSGGNGQAGTTNRGGGGGGNAYDTDGAANAGGAGGSGIVIVRYPV
jgi:hypothetical protein